MSKLLFSGRSPRAEETEAPTYISRPALYRAPVALNCGLGYQTDHSYETLFAAFSRPSTIGSISSNQFAGIHLEGRR
jgi:hypothetical protein